MLAAACTSDSSPDSGSGARQVIVDTDMGVDDVRAIMLLLEHPDVEVIAVSVSGTGLGRCPQSAHNAAAILDALGAVVPVGCGSNRPREGFNTFPTAFRDSSVELAGMQLDLDDGEVTDAVELMADVVDDTDGLVTLLALGPLTNVAQLLDDPAVADGIDEIWIMGGAVDVGGNIISFSNYAPEFNVWIDPVAADRVLRSGLAVTMVPLDATNHVPLTPAFALALADGPETRAASLLLGNLEASPPDTAVYHWDDLAAAALVDPSTVSFTTIGIEVDTEIGSDTEGQTRRSPDGPMVRVALDADRPAFERLFFETLTGVARTTDGLWAPDATIVYDGHDCTYQGPDPLDGDLGVRIDNASGRPGLGVVFGTYTDEASEERIQAMLDRGVVAPPSFFRIHTVAPLPANTVGYATARDLTAEVTIWCAVDDVIELAGPRVRSDR